MKDDLANFGAIEISSWLAKEYPLSQFKCVRNVCLLIEEKPAFRPSIVNRVDLYFRSIIPAGLWGQFI